MATVPEAVDIGESVIFQSLGEEVVLLNMTSQQYYNLDDVGASMWNVLVEQHDVEASVGKLKELYDVDEEKLRQDLHALIEQLIAVDLLKKA